ncbi:MAG: response regulator [Desulfobacteraceae bacterium]|nr:response regulator [Desulfobacteraceae bacterium]
MARILVIDDDHQVQKMLKQMLEREGYEVAVANDGNEGLDSYRNTPYDLVITDLIMPEKEGVETILDLKKEFNDVKIIAISGGGRNTPDQYLKVAKQLGALQTFAKPIKRNDLVQSIRDLLAVSP